MHAEIIAVGDELTSGQCLDTNSQWISQRLEELGVCTMYHTTVGDQFEPCVEVFRRAIARAEVVVITGGLGPTADDLTRQALAEATGRQLVLRPEVLESIREMFARRGRTMPPQNQLQAMFPAESRVIDNRHGTAPGIDLEAGRPGQESSRVMCLPGVPAEMVEMWQDYAAPAIAQLVAGRGAARVIRRKRIHCFGAGESQIEALLPDLIRRGRRPEVGITASHATITLRIAADGRNEAECRAAIESVAATIRQSLGNLVFGEDDDELQHAVIRLLRERRMTLATAESAAGGLIAQWLAGVKGSAEVFYGGLVLPRATDDADSLATKCRDQFGADLGLAAGPLTPAGADSGGSQTVAVALASPHGIERKLVPLSLHPSLVQIYCAKHALNLARLMLEKEGKKGTSLITGCSRAAGTAKGKLKA